MIHSRTPILVTLGGGTTDILMEQRGLQRLHYNVEFDGSKVTVDTPFPAGQGYG